MKLGLDIHGVITANPKLFSEISNLAKERNYEVHILTGVMLSDAKLNELKKYNIYWSHIFSIADFHRNLGTSMTFSDPCNPWIDHNLWDKTKANYCVKNAIDFHIDDTQRYGEYFKTIFALYDSQNNRFDWHKGTLKNGAFRVDTAENTLKYIEKIVFENKLAA